MGPVQGFAGLSFPHRATALVVGLGYDPGRALGIHEELDPNVVASFVARPAVDVRYERSTLEANRDFLELVDEALRFEYPILDFLTTFQRLDGICRGLSAEAGTVLVPLGPKIFALASFLVAARQREVSVWRVSAGTRADPVDRAAAGPVVAAGLVWDTCAVQPSFLEATELLELV